MHGIHIIISETNNKFCIKDFRVKIPIFILFFSDIHTSELVTRNILPTGEDIHKNASIVPIAVVN